MIPQAKINTRLIWAFVFASVFVIMCLNLTSSCLNFDESVEFYYSKTLKGTVAAECTNSMYERILSTYQPPLFNILMYLWLSVSESLWWFRLLGVLVTFIGSAGLYKTVEQLTGNTSYSAFCCLIYLLFPCITYYMLDCSEYYLMLAFVNWSLYYFVKAIKDCTMHDIGLFILMSVLAVYSQYGAAIQAVILYFILLTVLIKRREKATLKRTLWVTVLTVLIAVLPLLYFFALPQMLQMGMTTTTHQPVLAYHNFFYDLVASFPNTLFFFVFNSQTGMVIYTILFLCALAIGICCKKRVIRILTFCFVAVWLLYYLLVIFNIYGIIVWNYESLGSVHIGMRYSLFMFPLFIVWLSASFYVIYRVTINRWSGKARYAAQAAWIMLGTFLAFFGLYSLWNRRPDKNFYTITDIIYDSPDIKTPIYILGWPKFQSLYHLTHDSRYYGLPASDRPDIYSFWYMEDSKIEEMLDKDEVRIILCGLWLYPNIDEKLKNTSFSCDTLFRGLDLDQDLLMLHVKKVTTPASK